MYNGQIKVGMIVRCQHNDVDFQGKVNKVFYGGNSAKVQKGDNPGWNVGWNVHRKRNGYWGGDITAGELTVIKGVKVNWRKRVGE